MNTKNLLNYARFCHVVVEDNAIVSIEWSDEGPDNNGTYLHTADGVFYYVPDQDVNVEGDFDGEIGPIKLQAIMPGRLPEDRNVEVTLVLQKLLPVTTAGLAEYKTKAEEEAKFGKTLRG